MTTVLDEGRPNPLEQLRVLENIVSNFTHERRKFHDVQLAMLNLLEDFAEERPRAEATHRATLNILEDAATEEARLESAQVAMINILGDFADDRDVLVRTQRAIINILDDLGADNVRLNVAQLEILASETALRTSLSEKEGLLIELETFSYTVSHNLRAPLRAIQAYASAVEKDIGDRAGPTARLMLGRMREAALRMDHLTRDLLIFRQIPNSPLASEPVDLDAVVQHVLAIYPDIAAAGVKVRKPLGWVTGQNSLLLQIVSNLLGNAIKFSPKDRTPEIEVWTERRDGGLLHVVVQDNGIGIPSEHITRIFKPFERLHQVAAVPGTGIGLAIVKKSAERMGGSVGVESEPGKGSRFWFELMEVKRAS